MGTSVAEQLVPVPEPELKPDELIAKAAALRSWLREEQDATEHRGVHSEELHEEFRKAGFYRTLQPRRYGGYEFDVGTFYRLAIELARGCPSTGWCVCLASGHALMLGSYFSEEAQESGFGPEGEFRAPSVAAPAGTATPVEDGWELKGQWAYASGAPYATHFMPTVLVKREGAEPHPGIALIPRSIWTMLDDWGAILGLRGSGSNSIVVDGRVPKSFVAAVDMLDVDVSSGTPGSALHGNPMYGGRCLSFFHGELVSIMVGLGYAAIDEYEEIIRARPTIFPPVMPRYLNHDHQRALGLAVGMVYAAERLALHAAEVFHDFCRRGYEGDKPFTFEEDVQLFTSLEHAGRLVWEAVETLFRTASSSAAKDGQRLQRYYRDISMYRGHLSAQYETLAQRLAAIRLGLQTGMVPPEANGSGA